MGLELNKMSVGKVSLTESINKNTIGSTNKVIQDVNVNINQDNNSLSKSATTLDLDSFIDNSSNSERLGTDDNISVDARKFDTSEISKDGYTVQGFTYTNDKMLVSAYKKDYLSIIYVYDKTGKLEGKIYTDTIAHVGGLTYDYNNGILFMSDKNGKTVAYDYQKLMQKQTKDSNYIISLVDKTKINIKKKIDTSELKANNDVRIDNNIAVNNLTKVGKNSTMYSFNDKIYVATYDTDSKGQLVEFNTEYRSQENTLLYDDVTKINFLKNIQGIAFTEYGGKKFLLATQSVGIAPSQILLYDVTNGLDNRKYIGKKNIESGAEGIDIGTDGGVVTVVNERHDSITQMDFDDLYKECKHQDSISESAKKIAVDVLQDGNNLAANVADSVSNATSPIADKVSSIGNDISNIGKTVADATGNVKDTVVNKVESVGSDVSNAADDLINDITNLL